jgi:hypothetical protein
MSVSGAGKFIAVGILALCPTALLAQGPAAGILHNNGGVWVNGAEVAVSTALFVGDVIETKPGFVANLDVEGSSVLVQGESIVTFQGTFLALDHGSVEVGTSTRMSVHVKCIRVDPVSSDRTQYDVTDLNGKVEVDAKTKDVTIRYDGLRAKPSDSDSNRSATVHEGEQATRDESVLCGGAERPIGQGGGINSKWIKIGGGVAAAAVLCALLCKGTSSSNVSPWQP